MKILMSFSISSINNLQETISIILPALVENLARLTSGILEEYIRHRVEVYDVVLNFSKGCRRKHVVEGQLLALADIGRS